MRFGARAERYSYHYEHVLGTSLELRVVADSESAARHTEGAVLLEIDRLASVLSGHSTTSEFARWQETRGDAVPVSPELAEVLDLADRWRLQTNGAFNPAVQAIADLLHGAPDFSSADLAGEAIVVDVAAPLWSVDRSQERACRLTRLPVTLDAIAKGFIVHRAAQCGFEMPGVTEVLLNVGGDIHHFGPTAIAVGIANPFDASENAAPVATIRIQNEALATSGGYRRGFSAEGRWHSHIVDPVTRRPANQIASASVFARDGATADALSTAFSVLTPRNSIALAESIAGVGCLLIDECGAVSTSAGWRRRAGTIAAGE